MSSTTFDSQLDIATRVAAESPELYYEIQSLNDYGEESLSALRAAVERVWQAVHGGDADSFVGMMRRGHEYLRVRQAARDRSGAEVTPQG
jgi:chorismate mutase/prephenate dehydrogenase